MSSLYLLYRIYIRYASLMSLEKYRKQYPYGFDYDKTRLKGITTLWLKKKITNSRGKTENNTHFNAGNVQFCAKLKLGSNESTPFDLLCFAGRLL